MVKRDLVHPKHRNSDRNGPKILSFRKEETHEGLSKAHYKTWMVVEPGQIAVPEIQRDVVWKPEQVKELVRSIFSDYPCGSLIVWEPSGRRDE